MEKKKMPARSQWQQVINDPDVRKEVAQNSHLAFFHIYMAHHVKYRTAPFQRELFALSEDESKQFCVIEAFRGSAKSTIMNLSYPIWSIIGKQRHKFILILAQTQNQSRQYLSNIKKELEDNTLLRADFGPFEEPDDEWRNASIVLPRYDARIMAASLETPIRGLKHKSYRPSLIIVDDLEDLAFIKSSDNRDKAFNWIFGDVVPMGEPTTRVVVIGTRLHDDSLIMRLRQGIEENRLDGVAKRFPLIDELGNIAWPGKYETVKDIEILKKTVPSEAAWQREYLLNIVADEDAVIRKEWIQYYEQFPGFDSYTGYSNTFIGVDLAIKEGMSNDYTAMVAASVYDGDGGYKIFIQANPINVRMSFPKTIEAAKQLSDSVGGGNRAVLIIESVAYQSAVVQQLNKDGYYAEEYNPHGNDKRQRLQIVSAMISNGQILFAQLGSEVLVKQILGLGQERHDDLVDAFTTAVLKIIDTKGKEGRYIVPRSPTQLPAKTTAALEKEADIAQILEQEYERSNFNWMMRK